MKTWTDRIVDMMFRGVAGLVVIYILGQFCLHQELPILAGVNPGTFFLTAIFGLPGFLLIFATTLIYLY